ncbi:hypothetical protein PGH26_02220 [Sporosarcina jeotgali]|uniref:Uncharacterized protein n=1 Tax=Sporosarcina jeotgali TaxID=3020056 RepID=A0ABZ0KXQ3_9BACL|nr:hypothetical protein [Sporosarcina sp. B2O-1]WOV84764.1 hypothetical protein PGH26_02220 [Sporosarcina sp. B2O-1]
MPGYTNAVGEGEVTFDSVTVKGETKILGGGPNSIHFKDSVLVTVIVNKNNGSIRVVAEGATTVQEVLLESSAILEAASSAATIENVEIMEGVANSTGPVKLIGTFDTVNNRATSVEIQLPRESSVNELILSALSFIKGQGLINRLNVTSSGNDSTVESKPQSVVLDISGHVTVDGEKIEESYSNVVKATIQSIQATMSYTRVDLKEPKYDLTAQDFIITAESNGQTIPLTNLTYNATMQMFMYNPLPVSYKDIEITVRKNPASDALTEGVFSKKFYSTEGFSGRITDIFGKGLANMSLTFEDSYVRGVTDRNGYYFVEAQPGVHYGTISGPGFIKTTITGSVATGRFTTGINETAIRAAATDEMKIMLTWNDMESDMDSHLATENFHVYYGDKTYGDYSESGKYMEYVDLDWDDTQYFGPETTTIRKWQDGRYIFFLHNYSGDNAMSLSDSKVQIFQGNSETPTHTFNVPADTGDDRYWGVFELFVSENGRNMELKELNQMARHEEWLIRPYDSLLDGIQSLNDQLSTEQDASEVAKLQAVLTEANTISANKKATTSEFLAVLRKISKVIKYKDTQNSGPLYAFLPEYEDYSKPFEWKGFIRENQEHDLRDSDRVTLKARIGYWDEDWYDYTYLANQKIQWVVNSTGQTTEHTTKLPANYDDRYEAILFDGTYGELKSLYSQGFLLTTTTNQRPGNWYTVELALSSNESYNEWSIYQEYWEQ